MKLIRKFNEKDTDSIILIWRNASELAHWFLENDFLDKEAIALRDVYLKFTETWVSEIDGKLVGFIALANNEVAGLFLDPKYHGQGLGRALVDKAVSEKGSLSVEVFKENTIGRHFYNAYGFRGSKEYFHEPSGHITIKMNYSK